MPKTDIVSAQWLAEQILRVAKTEPNHQSALNRGVNSAELVDYADAVSRYVNEDATFSVGQEASPPPPENNVGMMV